MWKFSKNKKYHLAGLCLTWPPTQSWSGDQGSPGQQDSDTFSPTCTSSNAHHPYYYVLYSSVRLSISCSVSLLSAQCDRDAITFEAASFIDLMIIVSSVPKVIKVCTKSDHNLNQKWPKAVYFTSTHHWSVQYWLSPAEVETPSPQYTWKPHLCTSMIPIKGPALQALEAGGFQ